MRPPRDPRGGTAAAVPLGRSILSGSFLGAPSPTRRSPAPRARPLCRGAPLSLMGRESHPTVPGTVRDCGSQSSLRTFLESRLNFCYGLFLLLAQLCLWSLGWFFFFSWDPSPPYLKTKLQDLLALGMQ